MSCAITRTAKLGLLALIVSAGRMQDSFATPENWGKLGSATYKLNDEWQVLCEYKGAGT